ncbi:MAG: hypothetical protein ACYDEY_14900 [Acidimicrobiales bacterium]
MQGVQAPDKRFLVRPLVGDASFSGVLEPVAESPEHLTKSMTPDMVIKLT